MISRFNYSSMTVHSMLRDVSNYADIEAINSNRQNWHLANVCINDSIIALKKLFLFADTRSETLLASVLMDIFRYAKLDSNMVELTEDGKIFFSFRNGELKIVAANGTLEYSFATPNSFLESSDFLEMNMWKRLTNTLKEFY